MTFETLRSTCRNFLLAGASLLLGAGCESRARGNASVAGTIAGPFQSGVTVTVAGGNCRIALTDAAGRFAVTGLLPGPAAVTARLPGHAFRPPVHLVDLKDGEAVPADFATLSRPELPVDPSPPARTVPLVFIHHSCGDNWLNALDGGLGDALGLANYHVSDIHYGWSAPENPGIGDSTDIGHWYTWFADPTVQANGKARRDNILQGVLETRSRHASYTPIADPGGTNAIVLFKSCYPNSGLREGSRPPEALFGKAADSEAHTLRNGQEVYRRILETFKARKDHMFVAVTAPPLNEAHSDPAAAARARALNQWLVHGWLAEGDWEDRNVYVFDFFNVLTGPGSHHRVADGRIDHAVDPSAGGFAAYSRSKWDSHPGPGGNRKATAEFVPLLSTWYHRWQGFLGKQ